MIVSVLVSLLVFCNFVKKWYFNKYFKNVPEPAPCWPLLGHSPSFFIEKDHSSWHLKNTEQFRSFGLYRLRHILCMYIYLIILDCYSTVEKKIFCCFFMFLQKFFYMIWRVGFFYDIILNFYCHFIQLTRELGLFIKLMLNVTC